jgi:hypothetical protein
MSESYDRAAFASLQGLLKKRPPVPGERCDYCATPLEPEHGHLVDLRDRRILCSCRPCRIVFEPGGAAQGRYRVVPSRYLDVADFTIEDARWDELQVPIGLAFFFFNSLEKKMVAFYPGPAGATESLLPLEAWDALATQYPAFATLEPDVEAIVIDRRALTQCFIVPIDAAYELVGLMRLRWRGFDGGAEARELLDGFFEKLRARCRGRATAPRP